jgi:hypothetical protein
MLQAILNNTTSKGFCLQPRVNQCLGQDIQPLFLPGNGRCSLRDLHPRTTTSRHYKPKCNDSCLLSISLTSRKPWSEVIFAPWKSTIMNRIKSDRINPFQAFLMRCLVSNYFYPYQIKHLNISSLFDRQLLLYIYNLLML